MKFTEQQRYWIRAMKDAEKMGFRVGALVLIPNTEESIREISVTFALPNGLEPEDFLTVMRGLFAGGGESVEFLKPPSVN
jgi:hypothetical protein